MEKFKMSFVLAVVLIIFSAPYALAEQTLRVVGSWSSLTLYKNIEHPFWTDTVPKALGADTKVIMTSLNQINIQGAAVMRQMDMGVFDVVHTVVDYVVSDCPELAGLDLPALAMDIKTARKVVDAYKPVMEKALEKTFNVKLLALTPYPAQILFSNVPITSLKDLRGKKIRASGWTTAQFIDALGAAGVNISFAEAAQSLQRGVVDGAVTGSLSGYNAGWGDVTKYLYPLPIGGWDYVMSVISLKTWNKLTVAQQKTLQKLALDNLETPGWAVTDEETQMGIYCLTGSTKCKSKPANLKLIKVDPNDVQMARNILTDKVLPAWSKEAGTDVVKRWNDTIGAAVNMKVK
jgi:TRAP-type C4-dicarboxylate transport system substrate-binding protein